MKNQTEVEIEIDGSEGGLTIVRENEELKALVKQTQAEFENYQKRNAKEREAERKYSITLFALDLLSPIDNMERALDAAKQGGDNGSLVQGVAGTQKQLLDVLARHGVTSIEVQPGSPLDPTQHEAVMQEPHPTIPTGMIVRVLHSGFRIFDRILRPAGVSVSRGKE